MAFTTSSTEVYGMTGSTGPKISRVRSSQSAGAFRTICGAILRVAASHFGPGTSCTSVAPRSCASSRARVMRLNARSSMTEVKSGLSSEG